MPSRSPRYVVPRGLIDQIQRSSPVTNALEAKAARMLPRAQRNAINAGLPKFARSLRIERGVRPGTKSPTGLKRQFVRIIATSEDAADYERGNRGVTRAAVLRRSIGA